MRAFFYPILMLVLLTTFGCGGGGGSDRNSDAPDTNAAHPAGWISQHGAAANSSPGYAACVSCHGGDLRGQGGAPSCYSASFNGQSCHAGGPGAPHPLDGTYLDPANHGPDAKADLTVCQGCHGQAGGPGSNPRFNRGIRAAGGQGCESCHGVNLAHPAAWAGPNNTFHYTAGNIQTGCTLCHGTALNGVGGVGVSCLGCHDSVTTFTLDCTFCHGYPPTGTADQAAPSAVAHRGAAAVGLHNVCVACHGAKENASGGYFSAVPAYALFNKSTNTPGAHWDGRINMNGDTAYNATNFGCDTAVCHGNDLAHQLSDSQLPVVLGNYGSGSGAIPHPIPFTDPALHGPAAKGMTAAFPNGLVDCQPCHASATTPPRFNVGIAAAGGTGCEGCHNDFTAHPSSGGRDNVPWYNGGVRHDNAQAFTVQCALCHGASLQGDFGPACTSCHPGDPIANPSGCVSCHNLPPNGDVPAGNVRPNRTGQHSRGGHVSQTCATCHSGAVYRTPSHFDFAAPATVQFSLTGTDTMTFDAATSTCTGTCHTKAHTGFGW
ncbi:MAG: hypothetical protein FIB02_06180 [Desulfuromonas sp.]|nr:hypothetical protein [Desulfuromonas sp.]